jgi:hemolysin activation/secretion protein
VVWQWALVALTTLPASHAAFAEGFRDGAQAQREQIERIEQWRREQERRALQAGPGAEPRWRAPEAGERPCFVVEEVWVEAAGGELPTLRPLTGRQRLLGGFVGACLGVRSIEALRANIEDRLIAAGYITTRLVVPAQDLSDGRLIFTLLPGLVESVVFDAGVAGGRPPAPNAVSIAPGDVLDLREVEHTLENLARLPSQQARFVIEPGQAEGTSAIRILPQGGRGWQAVLGAERAETSDYGPWQASLQLAVDAPLGLSDQAGVLLSQSRRQEQVGTQTERPAQSTSYLYWTAPLGRHAITLSLSRAEFTRFLAGGVGRFSESGRDDSARARWQWTPWRSASARLTVWAAASERRSRNFIDDIELVSRRRLATSLEQGVELWQRRGPCHVTADAEATQVQRMERDSEFQLPLEGLPRQWRAAFQWGCRAGGGVDWLGQAWIQRVAHPVDGTDLAVLGSRHTVRGHSAAETRVGRGLTVLRQELQSAPWRLGTDLRLRFSAALDWGRIHRPSDAGQRSRELAALAAGLRWQASRWSGELIATRALGVAADTPRPRDRGWLGGLRFAL